MGKTPKPLRIAVSADVASWYIEFLDELRAKGHTVEVMPPNDWDLILAPQAARFLPGMEQFLDEFIKGARKVKYPAKIKA